MRLRTKLPALIALASVVPIVGATLVGRELARRRFEAQFRDTLAGAQREVQARYGALKREVTRAVENLASPEDQFVGSVLIDLARGGLDDETVRRLAIITPRVMRERGLDVLTLVDRKRRILASGHFPGRIGDREADAERVAGKEAQLVRQRMLERDKPTTRLAVVARRTARSPLGIHVEVTGGRALGSGLMAGLSLRRGTMVLIRDAAGRRLAGPRSWSRYGAYPHETLVLHDVSGRRAATVTVAVADDDLRRTLVDINLAAGVLLGSALLVALVLGVLASGRFSRPLVELAEGAAAVAQGDLERQLPVRSRDEIGDMVRAFNQMTTDLRDYKEKLVAAERVAAWREVARRIAHEIKNPLFPIQTSMETLRKAYHKQHPELDEIFDESTATVLEEVQRLKNIATEFSQFARMPKPHLVPCDLGEVLGGVLQLYAMDDVQLEGELPDALPQVVGDREQLTQVFVNLVKNAREALKGAEAPRITLRAAVQEQEVVVSVEDNGPGLSQEVEDKIFTPYFTTKGASGGSGLGLAIVQRIIMDHGGRIEAHNLEQGGAQFQVSLPRGG